MQNELIRLLSVGLLLHSLAIAQEPCFILAENHQIITQTGDCTTRYAPCSTFKIALSLMGYNEGLLIDETHPEWPYQDGYANDLAIWQQPHNPQMWLQNSCVWYSQILTQKLGMAKFKAYTEQFHYGNQDVSGDKGRANGLTQAWLSSSLAISPIEQLHFLQKLIDNALPVSISAQQKTKEILFAEELANGWLLYGKTGNGSLLNADRTQKLNRQVGWFIGWIQKEDRTLPFVCLIVDEDQQPTYASQRAKAATKAKLAPIVVPN